MSFIKASVSARRTRFISPHLLAKAELASQHSNSSASWHRSGNLPLPAAAGSSCSKSDANRATCTLEICPVASTLIVSPLLASVKHWPAPGSTNYRVLGSDGFPTSIDPLNAQSHDSRGIDALPAHAPFFHAHIDHKSDGAFDQTTARGVTLLLPVRRVTHPVALSSPRSGSRPPRPEALPRLRDAGGANA